MKKIFTLLAVLALSTTVTFAATTYGTNIKNAVKNDVKNVKTSVKDTGNALSNAVKQDVNNKKQAHASVADAKKAEKIKYTQGRLDALEAQRKLVKEDKTITETERTIKLRALDSQINAKKKEISALKK